MISRFIYEILAPGADEIRAYRAAVKSFNARWADVGRFKFKNVRGGRWVIEATYEARREQTILDLEKDLGLWLRGYRACWRDRA